ncbi:carbohydrate-binding family 9-like protein [Solitalea lacus]|uniref:carbohydrate-binding family 9-like protein n=1 Tax=Solitalea lacus TaxID=2911172 RepID=UPI001EDA522D|nr:carbohydrate-binding family 9-like protein [Solitalea lacus]UKJ07890.1 carbohydrate-binding family 9-like protein [Solitalea lacus]
MISPKAILSSIFTFSTLALSAQNIIPPKEYSCLKTEKSIKIDGNGSDLAWQEAQWSSVFVDIEGDKQPAPFLKTRIKMLWNDVGLSILADLEEPHVQASITQRDAVIFHDNDFEVFIDPDNDGINYYEIEINALNTVWDLMLSKAYSKGGKPDNSWTAMGLETAVSINGTLNQPADKDSSWTVEMMIPWTAFKENRSPKKGEQWKINFSRVQWRFDVENNKYVKRKNSSTGKSLPELNWVWSPMSVINMHIPERWGWLKFED